MMEHNRVGSHLIALATGGMELGATTVMTVGFREREDILRIFEQITGLRMNHAYVRPGGVAQDIPPGSIEFIREKIPSLTKGEIGRASCRERREIRGGAGSGTK